MLTTETPDIVVHGRSVLADPLAALRAALQEGAKAMAAHGALPTDLVAMTWIAPQPAAIHPGRAIVDMSYRESFGGFRPPLTVRAGAGPGVQIEIRLRTPKPASAMAGWGTFNFADLAREYSPRATVRDMPAICEAWRTDGAAFRARHLVAEIPYGSTSAETIDIYLPTEAKGPLPLWIFIHGGYWQAMDKEHNAQFAAGMLEAGYAVAMPNYTLAPAASLATIVQQTHRAVECLVREAAALGCDPAQLHVAGHSAGGHLAAMMVAEPLQHPIRSCLALSGLFDLAPLAALPLGRLLGLVTAGDVAALSPQRHALAPDVRLGVAVGGAESAEFQRQSVDFARAWGDASCHIIPGRNHFNLLEDLNGGALLDYARQIAR